MADLIKVGIGSPTATPNSSPKYTEVNLIDKLGPANEWEVLSGNVLGYNRGDMTESGNEIYLKAGGTTTPRATLKDFSLFSLPEIGETGSTQVLGETGTWQWKVLKID